VPRRTGPRVLQRRMLSCLRCSLPLSIPVSAVRQLIDDLTDGHLLGLFGSTTIKGLELYVALDAATQ